MDNNEVTRYQYHETKEFRLFGILVWTMETHASSFEGEVEFIPEINTLNKQYFEIEFLNKRREDDNTECN